MFVSLLLSEASLWICFYARGHVCSLIRVPHSWLESKHLFCLMLKSWLCFFFLPYRMHQVRYWFLQSERYDYIQDMVEIACFACSKCASFSNNSSPQSPNVSVFLPVSWDRGQPVVHVADCSEEKLDAVEVVGAGNCTQQVAVSGCVHCDRPKWNLRSH